MITVMIVMRFVIPVFINDDSDEDSNENCAGRSYDRIDDSNEESNKSNDDYEE